MEKELVTKESIEFNLEMLQDLLFIYLARKSKGKSEKWFRKLVYYRKLGLSWAETSRLLNTSIQSIQFYEEKMRMFGVELPAEKTKRNYDNVLDRPASIRDLFDEKKCYTPKEVADILSLDVSTIYRVIKKQSLPTVTTFLHLKIIGKDIIEYIERVNKRKAMDPETKEYILKYLEVKDV